MSPSQAELHSYERASKYPKSTRYGRQNPIAERWNSEEQLLIWRKNWADINYLSINDYKVAENSCKKLIEIVRENNLLVLFAKTGMGEQLVDFICMAFARTINSLVYQNQMEVAISYLTENYTYVSSLASITVKYQKLPAFLVYSLARKIEDKQIRAMCADYAIEIVNQTNEQQEANKIIKMLCLELKQA